MLLSKYHAPSDILGYDRVKRLCRTVCTYVLYVLCAESDFCGVLAHFTVLRQCMSELRCFTGVYGRQKR